jgi:hypothetical protein
MRVKVAPVYYEAICALRYFVSGLRDLHLKSHVGLAPREARRAWRNDVASCVQCWELAGATLPPETVVERVSTAGEGGRA